MKPMKLEGIFSDADSTEPVTWLITNSHCPSRDPRYGVSAEVRGTPVQGHDFTVRVPVQPTNVLPLNTAGELDHCTLAMRIPARVAGRPDADGVLLLTFDLGAGAYEPVVEATLSIGDTTATARQDERLEVVLGSIAEQLGDDTWECCLTCGLSDYSPGGNGNMGMRCHRDARSQYLASRGKWEYWAVPVTEEVPEFYWCDQFEHRRPGTGYRG